MSRWAEKVCTLWSTSCSRSISFFANSALISAVSSSPAHVASCASSFCRSAAFASFIRLVRASDHEALSAGWIVTEALEKLRTSFVINAKQGGGGQRLS